MNILALVAVALAGFAIGAQARMREFVVYSCKGYQLLVSADQYKKQAMIAAYIKQPRTDAVVISSNEIAPSDPDMFAPSMVFEIGIQKSEFIPILLATKVYPERLRAH